MTATTITETDTHAEAAGHEAASLTSEMIKVKQRREPQREEETVAMVKNALAQGQPRSQPTLPIDRDTNGHMDREEVMVYGFIYVVTLGAFLLFAL